MYVCVCSNKNHKKYAVVLRAESNKVGVDGFSFVFNTFIVLPHLKLIFFVVFFFSLLKYYSHSNINACFKV